MDNYFSQLEIGSGLSCEAKRYIGALSPRHAEIFVSIVENASRGNLKKLEILRNFKEPESAQCNQVETSDIEMPIGEVLIKARIYRPTLKNNISLPPALLYIHGGGWVVGSVENSGRYCSEVAQKSGCAVFSIGYRLSPEFRYPAAENDCLGAFKWLIKNVSELGVDEKNIFIGGDSAGGQLAAWVVNALIQSCEKAPRALMLFYPVTTLQERSDDESYLLYGSGYALDARLMGDFIEAHAGKEFRWQASPQNINTKGKFPPTHAIISGCDILRDQGNEFAEKLSLSGAKVRHILDLGSTHMYITAPGMDEALSRAVNESTEFIKRHISPLEEDA